VVSERPAGAGFAWPRPWAARLLVVCTMVLCTTPASAQIQRWAVGGTGTTWAAVAQRQAGVVVSGTSLHPLELTPDENLTRQLAWTEGQPSDYRQEGAARVWDNSGTGGTIILVDGIDTTSTGDRFQKKVSQSGREFFFDLGVAFPINRVVFYPPPDVPELAIRAFEVFGNDGEQYSDFDRPVYASIRRVDPNEDVISDLRFLGQDIRFLRLRTLARDAFDLAEVEIYGDGFVPSSSYLSELHEFSEGPVNFGRLLVGAELLDRTTAISGDPAPTAVVQVRSGADDTPLTYFRRDRDTGEESEVSESTYRTLSSFIRGPVREDSENWSSWSSTLVVDSTGVFELPLELPSPRAFLQFRAAFAGDAKRAIQLNGVTAEYSKPLVDRAVGELAVADDLQPISRTASASAGADTGLVCDVRTTSTSAAREGYRGLRFAAVPPPIFTGLQVGDPPSPVVPDSVVYDSSGFTVYFAPVVGAAVGHHSVSFRATVLEYATEVGCWLVGARGGLVHPVAAGNAGGRINTSSLTVVALSYKPTVALTLASPHVTPNADGINDALTARYVLSQYSSDIGVVLEVMALNGSRVKTLADAQQAVGSHEYSWDGTDESGHRVAPGIYLMRLSVDTDARRVTRTRTVGVSY
jgi:hypothetical protein